MESLHLQNIIFAQLHGRKSTGPGKLDFLVMFPQFLNLLLIPVARLDGHWGTWTGCLIQVSNIFYCRGVIINSFDTHSMSLILITDKFQCMSIIINRFITHFLSLISNYTLFQNSSITHFLILILIRSISYTKGNFLTTQLHIYLVLR